MQFTNLAIVAAELFKLAVIHSVRQLALSRFKVLNFVTLKSHLSSEINSIKQHHFLHSKLSHFVSNFNLNQRSKHRFSWFWFAQTTNIEASSIPSLAYYSVSIVQIMSIVQLDMLKVIWCFVTTLIHFACTISVTSYARKAILVWMNLLFDLRLTTR